MPEIYRTTSKRLPVVIFLILVFILTLSSFLTTQAESFIFVKGKKIGDATKTSSQLKYFQGNIPARDFYNYYKSRPNTGLENPRSCLIIPYMSPSNRRSLIIVMGDPGSPYSGTGRLRVEGLPEYSKLLVRDDPPNIDQDDEYDFSPPHASFHWLWGTGFADGVVIGDLGDNPDLKLEFELLENVAEARVLTGSPRNHRVLSLDPNSDIQLRGMERVLKPEPSFSVPELPRVGSQLTFNAAGSSTPGARIVQYAWDFDDDGHFSYASQSPVATHTFYETGEHLIALRVRDSRGNEAIKKKKIWAVNTPVEAHRKLSARKILPGGSVNCSVKIEARAPVSAVGIEESIPEGWKVTNSSNSVAIYKSSSDQWLIPEKLVPGETRKISFNIEAPSASRLNSDELNQTLEFSGQVSSGSPEFRDRIGGDSKIVVSQKVEPLVALAHYEASEGKLDFGLSSTISDSQIRAAIQAWQNGNNLPGLGEKTPDFEFIKKALLYHQKGIDPSIELSQVSPGDPHVVRKISTGLPDDLLFVNSSSPLLIEGEPIVEFSVQVIIKAGNRTLMGVGLEDDLPENWKILPQENENLAFKPSTGQWVITKPLLPGEEVSASYTLRVPLDEYPGTYSISGTLSESWSGSRYSVGGDHSLELLRTLPIDLVISRWNIESGKLDLSLDNYISEPQSKKAIEFWVNDEPVPHTGGEKLSFEIVKRIVAYQLEGKPVTSSN